MLVDTDADHRLVLGSGLFAVVASTVPSLIRLVQLQTGPLRTEGTDRGSDPRPAAQDPVVGETAWGRRA